MLDRKEIEGRKSVVPPNDAVSILREQKKIGIILITSGERDRERERADPLRRRIHCLEKRSGRDYKLRGR